jgi:hypothetical protein
MTSPPTQPPGSSSHRRPPDQEKEATAQPSPTGSSDKEHRTNEDVQEQSAEAKRAMREALMDCYNG